MIQFAIQDWSELEARPFSPISALLVGHESRFAPSSCFELREIALWDLHVNFLTNARTAGKSCVAFWVFLGFDPRVIPDLLMSKQTTHQEHPLANILVNVLIPVLVLSYLSKDPELQERLGKSARFWHIGPVKAIIVALALPLGYGIWHFVKKRQFNFFSGLGLFSVLLTGGLTLYLWNPDGSVKEHAGILFGLKEAAIPLALGFGVFLSRRSATPLLQVFLYNDAIFDIPKIEKRIDENDRLPAYRLLLDQANLLFAGSFFLSAGLNLLLALWFFRGFDRTSVEALQVYNGIIGKLTGWGFAVIGVPLLVILFFILKRLLNGLSELTGLKDEELLLPR